MVGREKPCRREPPPRTSGGLYSRRLLQGMHPSQTTAKNQPRLSISIPWRLGKPNPTAEETRGFFGFVSSACASYLCQKLEEFRGLLSNYRFRGLRLVLPGCPVRERQVGHGYLFDSAGDRKTRLVVGGKGKGGAQSANDRSDTGAFFRVMGYRKIGEGGGGSQACVSPPRQRSPLSRSCSPLPPKPSAQFFGRS